jgi:hypothetical protein
LVRTNHEPTCRGEDQEQDQEQDQTNCIATSAANHPAANNNPCTQPSPLVSHGLLPNVLELEHTVTGGEEEEDVFFHGVIEILDHGGTTQESHPQRQGEVLAQYSDTQSTPEIMCFATRYAKDEEQPSLFHHDSPDGCHAFQYKDKDMDMDMDMDMNSPPFGRGPSPLVSQHKIHFNEEPILTQRRQIEVQAGDASRAKTNASGTQAIDLQPKHTRLLEDTGTFSIASKIEAQEQHPANSASAWKSALDRNVSEESPFLEAPPPENTYGTHPSELQPTQKELKTFRTPRAVNAPSNTTKICPPGQSDLPSIPPVVQPSKDSNRTDDELGGPAIEDNASVSESYVSTLPPGSDCSSEGSVENLDFTSDNQDSSERNAVSSKRSHSTVASKNEAPKPRRPRRIQTNSATKKHNALKRNDVNSEPATELGGSSRQRDNTGTRLAERPPLQDRLNARAPSSVAFSSRSNTPDGIRRKHRVKNTTRKRPRDTPEPELPAFENDSDSVEILGFSLPTSTKKPRPFSKSSIVPDWVPSTGLQSISQQFQDDIPWNITADKPLSNPKEAPIKSIVLPYRNIANKDAAEA